MVAVVLAAHALLLYGLLRITVLRESDTPDVDTAIQLLDAADFPAPEAAPVAIPESREPRPPAPLLPTQPPAATATAGGADALPGSTTATGAAPRGPVDWYRIGETVARERVERAAAAARPVRAPFRKAQEGPRSTIFDSGKRRRTGTSEKLADGESIFWINENCYVTTDSDSLLQKDLHDAHRGMTRCVVRLGKRKARGDLFDNLPNHKRSGRPADPTLPDARGGTGPGGVPEPIPEPVPNAELEIIEPGSAASR